MAAVRRGDNTDTDAIERLECELQVALEGTGGTLGSLRRTSELDRDEILIVLLLLKRLLADSGPGLKGKRILRFLFSSTYSVLRGTRYLDAGSPLRSLGIIECMNTGYAGTSYSPTAIDSGLAPGGNPDVLESEFRLSPSFFERVRAELAPPRVAERAAAAPAAADSNTPTSQVKTATEPSSGYADNIEYLLDLRQLASIYRRRSEAAFRGDEQEGSKPSAALAAIDAAIERKSDAIRVSLQSSSGSTGFAAADFQRKYRLSDEEMVLIVTLLFQEIHTGNPFSDGVELLKLACCSERELIEKRSLLSDRGALLRNEILSLEDGAGSPELAGEACLAPWAVEALLGRERDAIDSDLRLDFHEYIQNISDSQDFFTKLRLPPQRDS